MFAVVAALIAAASASAKPAASSISLNGAAVFGGQVSFTYSSPVSEPFVHLRCFQNGALVEEAWGNQGFPEQREFTLGPTGAWQSGPASCTATLEDWSQYGTKGKVTVLASTSFQVSG